MARDTHLDNLIRGLSDFWVRFFADSMQLEAFYEATETQLAQAYLELLSSFLGISVGGTPLFNTEYFRLVKIREDEVYFKEAIDPNDDRHIYTFADAVVAVPALQNKVFAATAALVPYTNYEFDAVDYQIDFYADVTGTVGRSLAVATDGSLLTYGTGALTRCYTAAVDSTPFTYAKVGHWVRVSNSIVGNNHTYRIGEFIDSQNVLLEGTFTLPETHSGSLRLELLDSAFSPLEGYGRRNITVETGGSFDDPALRALVEQATWSAATPIGLGVRKGDVLRILDHATIPTAPTDYTVGVVRHDRLCVALDTPLPTRHPAPSLTDVGRVCTADVGSQRILLASHGFVAGDRVIFDTTNTLPAPLVKGQFYYARDVITNVSFKIATYPNGAAVTISDVGTGTHKVYAVGESETTKLVRSYAILRTPPVATVVSEALLFTRTGTTKPAVPPGVDGYTATDRFYTPSVPFALTDQQRFITITNAGSIAFTGTISAAGNTITNTGGVLTQAFARAGVGGSVTLSGSTLSQNGTYVISSVSDDYESVVVAGVALRTEILGVALNNVTNNGTYQIRNFISTSVVTLDQPLTYPDPNNGTLQWTVHDGYCTTLVHDYVDRGSLFVSMGIGSPDTGGYHLPIEDEDYKIDYETGLITQLGRHAGTWSLDPLLPQAHCDYTWKEEIFSSSTALATLYTTPEELTASVNEIAFWVPNLQVDQFTLYYNFGALIEATQQASSESYREFIRGIFQLYMLGPTLARIESALNVICNMPVIRDDGETLVVYDPTSDISSLLIQTRRLNGDLVTYRLPVGTPIRTDITTYVPGTSTPITFVAFETLTTLFTVTDYLETPTWWDSVVIPTELMPTESFSRRTITPEVYENIVGQIDEPHVGDPGLYVGADDDGNVPAWSTSEPAKRHKMALVVMNKYLKYNIFFVHFDTALMTLFSGTFVNDLRRYVLTAKPGYILCYAESATAFSDVLTLAELDVTVDAFIALADERFPPGRALTIGSYWNIGDFYRYGDAQYDEALVTAPGSSVPAGPFSLAYDHVTTARITSPGTPIQEGIHYDLDYVNGVVTPIGTGPDWDAGAYTISYEYVIITPTGSEDITLGDSPFTVGGADLQPGNLGEIYYSDYEMPLVTELPLQIKQITI